MRSIAAVRISCSPAALAAGRAGRAGSPARRQESSELRPGDTGLRADGEGRPDHARRTATASCSGASPTGGRRRSTPGRRSSSTRAQSVTDQRDQPAAGERRAARVADLPRPGGRHGASCTARRPCVQGPHHARGRRRAARSPTPSRRRGPGTFLYSSASQPGPAGRDGPVRRADRPADRPRARRYATAEHRRYDREYLFLLSEMDSHIHDLVEQQGVAAVYQTEQAVRTTSRTTGSSTAGTRPTRWLRPAAAGSRPSPTTRWPDAPRRAGADAGHRRRARLAPVPPPRQPRARHRGGRPPAPERAPPAAARPVSHEVFTIQSVPGQTVDAIFSWTGKDLGWDIYGDPTDPAFAHTCSPGPDGLRPDRRRSDCADHGKTFPVALPDLLSTDFGGFWSGSPFLGTLGAAAARARADSTPTRASPSCGTRTPRRRSPTSTSSRAG